MKFALFLISIFLLTFLNSFVIARPAITPPTCFFEGVIKSVTSDTEKYVLNITFNSVIELSAGGSPGTCYYIFKLGSKKSMKLSKKDLNLGYTLYAEQKVTGVSSGVWIHYLKDNNQQITKYGINPYFSNFVFNLKIIDVFKSPFFIPFHVLKFFFGFFFY